MTTPFSGWRLNTTAGIKYKAVDLDGEISGQEARATATIIIRAVDLQALATELMPDPVRVGNIWTWKAENFPGFPSMVVDKLRFKAHDGDKPIDPFTNDPAAVGTDTYDDLVTVFIDYSTHKNGKKRNPKPNNPATYLEISATTSYEILNVYAGQAKLQIFNNPNVETADGEAGGDAEDGEDGTWINPSTGELFGTYTDPETGQIVRGPIIQPTAEADQEKTNKQGGAVPITIIVPITNWHVRWPDVDHTFFEDILMTRMRAAGGKVNRKVVPFLYDAYPETLLFTGWTYNERNSWRQLDGNSDEPPKDVTFNFSEKHILWNGLVKGWNDYWSNDEGGWVKLKVHPDAPANKTQRAYAAWDHNLIFTTQ